MLNNMTLQGRFTHDLEKKETSSGIEILNFSLAWNEKYKEKETTLFLNCVAYGSLATHIVKWFKKGDQVIVEGKLVTRSFEGNDGNKKYVTELLVNKVHFCEYKKPNNQVETDKKQSNVRFDDDDDDFTDDGLPF